MQILSDVRGYVLDMDGVLYRGDEPIEGAGETVERLREQGLPVRFLTNFPESRRSIRTKLKKVCGLEADETHIMTVAYATAQFIKTRGGGSVYALGDESLKEEVRAAGQLLSTDEVLGGNRLARVPDWLVVSLYDGHDFYRSLSAVGNILRSPAFNRDRFLATSAGYGWTRSDGLTPGVGTTLAALEYFATGGKKKSAPKPTVIGKPGTYMVELARAEWGDITGWAHIGDKWSDIQTAHELGMLAVKVESGQQDFFKGTGTPMDLPPNQQPDVVLESIRGIFDSGEMVWPK